MAEDKQPQLHQLLPAEAELAITSRAELSKALDQMGHRELFTSAVKTLTMLDEDRRGEDRVEVQSMTLTVRDVLDKASGAWVPWLDAFIQKERTNQDAREDLIVDGKTIATGVPATALLGLESKLKEISKMIASIPTLPAGRDWEREDDGTWSDQNPDEKMKTEKDFNFRILVEATDHHPAQIEKWNIDKPVGKYKTEVSVGVLSDQEKRELVGRMNKLLIATKQARHRANCTPVVKVKIGQAISDYLNWKAD